MCTAVARELSKTTASVVMIEAADDVCQGATKGNSGIVHAGFDDTPGSTRARLCWKGNQMFPGLDDELHFGYQLTGSLVVARGKSEEAHLDELMARGKANGVQNLRLVGRDELFQMEPHLDEAATAALFSPDAGTLIPYEYTIALAENAADNGVEARCAPLYRLLRTYPHTGTNPATRPPTPLPPRSGSDSARRHLDRQARRQRPLLD